MCFRFSPADVGTFVLIKGLTHAKPRWYLDVRYVLPNANAQRNVVLCAMLALVFCGNDQAPTTRVADDGDDDDVEKRICTRPLCLRLIGIGGVVVDDMRPV